MTAATLEEVLRSHLPRDRYDDEGASVGTYCICGGWEGDYFADGEAGPFDDHVAAAVRAWLADRLADGGLREAVAEAVGDVWLDGGHGLGCEYRDEPHDITATKATTAALAAVTAALTEGAGDE